MGLDKNLVVLFDKLSAKIQQSYEEGVTLEEAEKLAGEFLNVQLVIANELREADLDARMKKSGFKAVKAAIYMEQATKGEKKPSDVFIQNAIDMDKLVQSEQERLDVAEVKVATLENYASIFKEAHLHFRSIARGRFE